jgi:H2-forming N5,N10-methylenetetrahydromethanopterin dehydrogenase-like enzyme
MKKIDPSAYLHDKKSILLTDKQRWLDIIEMFYKQYQETEDKEHKAKLKEMMKFCGEQSQEIKKQLKNYK